MRMYNGRYELDNDEYNSLQHITKLNKMDCWFSFRESSDGLNYIIDLETNKKISLFKALKDINEGLLQETFDLLNDKEQRALNDLFIKYALKTFEMKNLSKKEQSKFSTIVKGEKIIFDSKESAIKYYETLARLNEGKQRKNYKYLCSQIKNDTYSHSDKSKVTTIREFTNEDFDNFGTISIPCKILNDNWHWEKNPNGTGYLESKDGNIYMRYNEKYGQCDIYNNGNWDYFYEGWTIFPENCNFFLDAENYMIEKVLQDDIIKKTKNDISDEFSINI